MSVWIDVVARVHRLSECIPSDRQLAAIGRAHDLPEVAAPLAALGLTGHAQHPVPGALELVRMAHRRAGAMLRLLSRWSAQRATLLSPLVEDEDCRSVHVLLRAALAGVAAREAAASLLPTPSLPLRVLSALADAGDAPALAALLTERGDPYGAALLAEVNHQSYDLLRLDTVLARTYAARARRVAPRSGRAMRTYVERTIDLANVRCALGVAERRTPAAADSLFVEGGDLVPREVFLEALALSTRREVAMLLTPFIRSSPIEAVTGTEPLPDERVLRALIREQRDIARLDPLGPAPIIEFVLRLRYTLLVLTRIITGLATPPSPAELAGAVSE